MKQFLCHPEFISGSELRIKSGITFLLIYLFAYLLIFVQSAKAQTMENGMYQIQEGDVSTFDIDSYVSKDNKVPAKPGEYSGVNYTVKSGSGYNASITPLTFSISSVVVDFGSLSPTNPVLRSAELTVNNKSVYGYKVTASENTQLTEVKSGAKIPDTTCDDGKCTEAVSSKWDSTLAYGLGYRCDSEADECVAQDTSFSQKSFYKQFPDSSVNESAATILSGGSEKAKEASVTFKVNIPSSQPQGLYSNTVTFLAIPSY